MHIVFVNEDSSIEGRPFRRTTFRRDVAAMSFLNANAKPSAKSGWCTVCAQTDILLNGRWGTIQENVGLKSLANGHDEEACATQLGVVNLRDSCLESKL